MINIAGDGCFRMNMNEIATAARYNVPVIEVVMNNHVLGMVRQWQTLFYGKRYAQTILNDAVDFVKLAEAMGAVECGWKKWRTLVLLSRRRWNWDGRLCWTA